MTALKGGNAGNGGKGGTGGDVSVNNNLAIGNITMRNWNNISYVGGVAGEAGNGGKGGDGGKGGEVDGIKAAEESFIEAENFFISALRGGHGGEGGKAGSGGNAIAANNNVDLSARLTASDLTFIGGEARLGWYGGTRW